MYSYKNNFGDNLSSYIITKLSGEEVTYYKPFSLKRFFIDNLRFIKKLILKGKWDNSLIKYSPFHKIIIGIGSILEESTNNCIVWGAGLSSRRINIKGGKFLSVRGPLSQLRLEELGYKVPETIGDPAILLPLIYKPNKKKLKEKFQIGIVPHKTDFNDIYKYSNKFEKGNILVIDLTESDIEKVIDNILSCQFILSSSLHGLIVAHVYNIPALRFQKNSLLGDGIKFKDYFKSVNISSYDPIDLFNIKFNNISRLFFDFEKFSLPNVNITIMQHQLINVAPFYVEENYQVKIKELDEI